MVLDIVQTHESGSDCEFTLILLIIGQNKLSQVTVFPHRHNVHDFQSLVVYFKNM